MDGSTGSRSEQILNIRLSLLKLPEPTTWESESSMIRPIWTSRGATRSKRIPGMPEERKTALTVKEYRPPTATAALDRTTIQRNDLLKLTSTASGSDCSGNLAYRWSASDGRLTAGPDAASTEFDGSNLAFSNTVQGQQCRPVTLTLEV